MYVKGLEEYNKLLEKIFLEADIEKEKQSK